MIINVLEVVDKHLINLAKNNFRDNSHFHASSWDGCKRQHAYAYYESQGFIKSDESALKIDTKLQRIFGNGHGMHDRWRSYLEATGALMGVWQCDNWVYHTEPKLFGTDQKIGCLKPDACNECGCSKFIYREIGGLDPLTMWGGHIDSIIDQRIFAQFAGSECKILPDENYLLIDFKSMYSFAFEKLTQPKSEHFTQVQIYLYLTGLKYGKLLYENKDSQAVKEFLVIADQEFIEIKKAEAISLKKIVTLTVDGKHRLPDRGFPLRTHKFCLDCKYRGHCWSDKHDKERIKNISQTTNNVSVSNG